MKVYVETNPETIYSGRVKDEVKTTEIRMWFETDEEIEVLSLVDYTKQVRKKMCEEIKKILLKQRQEIYKQIEDNSTDISYWTGHLDRLDVFEFEILDQLQGETK